MAASQLRVRAKGVTDDRGGVNGREPAVVVGDHVFALPGRDTTAVSAAAILSEQGLTAHFQVYYDDSLGANRSGSRAGRA